MQGKCDDGKKPIRWFQRYANKQFPVRVTEQSLPVLVAPHFHTESVELMLVSHGTVTATIGDATFLMYEGDVVFIPPDTFHRAMPKEEGSRIIGLTFDESILSMPHGGMLLYLFLGGFSDGALALWRGDEPLACRLAELIRRIFHEYTVELTGYEWAIIGGLYEIGTLLLREVESKVERAKQLKRGMTKLLPVLRYIDENYIKHLSIAELAELVSVSPDHFTKEFRNVMGSTPIKYINSLRVRKSLPYLLEGRLPIRAISEMVGFEDESYYNRVFRRQMGMSPMNYRKGAASAPGGVIRGRGREASI